MVADQNGVTLGGSVAINPSGFACSRCQQWVPPGTVHQCFGVNVNPSSDYPPIGWTVHPDSSPSLARIRVERQIAKLEAIETRAGAESWETVGDMHDVLACLRDLAEDL